MNFTILVNVKIKHQSGKFVPKDEIAEAVRDHLADNALDEVEVGDNSVYEVEEWDVEVPA
jgi:hypothetical protein